MPSLTCPDVIGAAGNPGAMHSVNQITDSYDRSIRGIHPITEINKYQLADVTTTETYTHPITEEKQSKVVRVIVMKYFGKEEEGKPGSCLGSDEEFQRQCVALCEKGCRKERKKGTDILAVIGGKHVTGVLLASASRHKIASD